MYHTLPFERLEDAAAFVGALSRYLSAPPGRAFGASTSALEVFVLPASSVGRTTVYLSDEAMRATTEAFGVPAHTSQLDALSLPPGCIPIRLTEPRVARGTDDIMLELSRAV